MVGRKIGSGKYEAFELTTPNEQGLSIVVSGDILLSLDGGLKSHQKYKYNGRQI